MRFLLMCAAMFVVLALSDYYILAKYAYSLGGFTWDQAKEIAWNVLLGAVWWKKAGIVLFNGALSYFGMAWALLPLTRKKK